MSNTEDNPTIDHDFDVSHLSGEERMIAELIRNGAAEIHRLYDEQRRIADWSDISGGGCKAFYTPEEWSRLGHHDSDRAMLVVCHDGGSLAQIFNHDYCDYDMIDMMASLLQDNGYFAEQWTSYSTGIFRIPTNGLQVTEERDDGT